MYYFREINKSQWSCSTEELRTQNNSMKKVTYPILPAWTPFGPESSKKRILALWTSELWKGKNGFGTRPPLTHFDKNSSSFLIDLCFEIQVLKSAVFSAVIAPFELEFDAQWPTRIFKKLWNFCAQIIDLQGLGMCIYKFKKQFENNDEGRVTAEMPTYLDFIFREMSCKAQQESEVTDFKHIVNNF